jgi:ATP-binding cassette, subfamily C, bacterial CydCD
VAFRDLAAARGRAYGRLERLAPAGLPAYRRGDLLTRMVRDVEAIQDRYPRVVVPALSAAVAAGGAAVLGFLLLPAAGLVWLAGLAAGGLAVPALATVLSRRADSRLATLRATLAERVEATLRGRDELLVLGALPAELAGVDAAGKALARAEGRAARTAGLAAALGVLSAGLTVVAALAVGTAALRGGTLAGPSLAVLALVPLTMAEVLSGLPVAAQHAQRVRASRRRLAELDTAPEPVPDPAVPLPMPAGGTVLRLRGLRARWPGAGTDALSGVDLDLAPGRRVAVVGESGSGKSTLAAVLLRFCPYTGGTATLNGRSLDALAGDDVRTVVGWCAADAHVFDSTLAANLRLAGPQAGWPAALAGARLDGWVAGLPRGLDTPVGEHGTALSGGQRQRLALARVLLADFPVVVLDEPTAHLDGPTAAALTRDLLAATADRATLLLTHDLTGLADVDEILVLAGGRVIQRGTHAELAAEPGWYRDRCVDAGQVESRPTSNLSS